MYESAFLWALPSTDLEMNSLRNWGCLVCSHTLFFYLVSYYNNSLSLLTSFLSSCLQTAFLWLFISLHNPSKKKRLSARIYPNILVAYSKLYLCVLITDCQRWDYDCHSSNQRSRPGQSSWEGSSFIL
jgi:hypothetical protein